MDYYKRHSYKESFKKKRHVEYEDYAYVLDYLPEGYMNIQTGRRNGVPIAQVIGEKAFTLLEIVPKTDLMLHERVFVGKGVRDKVLKINRKLSYDDLTATAKAELPYVIEEIIKSNESKFIRFFNEAPPITNRLHSLELLPGIGKKTMWEIIEARREKPFESFGDLRHRIKGIHDPVVMIASRIVEELQGKDRYQLFTGSKRIFRL